MTTQRQMIFWAVALVVALFLFWYFQGVLLPFIAGFVMAYFLDPLADRLERVGLSRLAASAVIVITAVLAIAGVLGALVPVLGNQIGLLIADLPQLSKQLVTLANDLEPQWLKDMTAQGNFDLQASLSNFGGKMVVWATGLGATVWSGSMAFFNIVSLLIITPVVAFYMLNDWDRMVAKVDSWLPREHVESVRAIARDVDVSLAGYIRGQGTVCLILAVFYALGFTLVGLKSGFAIGVMTGVLTFIPFFGALLGGGIAVAVGLLQFWPHEAALLGVVGVLAVGQFAEANFISPKLVGESVGLHPVWLLLSLLVFAYALGFLGLILAVPLAATTGVLVRHALVRYLQSDIYSGVGKPAPRQPKHD